MSIVATRSIVQQTSSSKELIVCIAIGIESVACVNHCCGYGTSCKRIIDDSLSIIIQQSI